MDLSTVSTALEDERTPLIRTWFGDDKAWHRVVDTTLARERLSYDLAPNVLAVDDPELDGAAVDDLQSAIGSRPGSYALVADQVSMTSESDLTLIYVDLDADAEVSEFRCETSQVADIDANLLIANMDFFDFATAVAPDGVFRGFNRV